MKKTILFLILVSSLGVIASGGSGAGGAGGQPGQPGQSGGRSCGGKGGNGGSVDQKKSFAGGCYGGGGRPPVNQPGGLSAGLGGSSGGAGGLHSTVNNSLNQHCSLYPLHDALARLNYYGRKEAQFEIEEILFRKSPEELNVQNAYDETPLMIAVQGGDFKNAQALLDTGLINLELKDNKGRTAFYLAYLEFRKKQLEPSPESLNNAQAILDLLFEHGAENSCRSKECSDMHDDMKAASGITHNQKPA